MTIDVGASGSQAEIPFSLYDDATGAPVTGRVWIAGDVKVRLPGVAYANATVGNIVEWGNGQYALQLTAGQTANPGKASIYVSVAGMSAQYGPEEIRLDPVAALMAFSHDTGLTVMGLFRRLDALAAGKATGLNSALASYYRRDGSTKAIDAVQDTTAGTRSTGTVTGSEP